MPTHLIVVSTYDPTYLSIYEHLVRSARAERRDVVVLDITPLLATPAESYHSGILRFFRLPRPGADLPDRVRALGAEYLAADRRPSDEPLPEEHAEALAIAVRSALITYFRSDELDVRRPLVARVVAGLRREGVEVFAAVRRIVRARRIDLAYVPNGRFPHQMLAMLAFHDAGVPTMHIEKGEGPRRAYVQGYAPQDRLRSQAAVDVVLGSHDSDSIERIAGEWLDRRTPADDSANQFSALWDLAAPPAIRRWREEGQRIVGFFTSSQDEFAFLGADWQRHSWADQYEAFDLMLRSFEAQGFRAYLRVHPNLATKADKTFRKERDGIRRLAAAHPGLEVIWHDDPANSYALLELSDGVVVWGSTIGLEASARGLPVWTAATSRYSLVADVHEVLNPADVERDGMRAWRADPTGARRFIAYLVERDVEVSAGEPWAAWLARPPVGARLAAIAVSGGTPGVGEAVRSLVDVYRHRRPRANLRRVLGR